MKRNKIIIILVFYTHLLQSTIPSFTLIEGYKDLKTHSSNLKKVILNCRDKNFEKFLQEKDGITPSRTKKLMITFNEKSIKFIINNTIPFLKSKTNSLIELYTKIFYLTIYKLISKFHLQFSATYNVNKSFKKPIVLILKEFTMIKYSKYLCENMTQQFLVKLGKEFFIHPNSKEDLFLKHMNQSLNFDFKNLFRKYNFYLQIFKKSRRRELNLVNYLSGHKKIFKRFGLLPFFPDFKIHLCKKILKSNEFKPVLSIMPELNLLERVINNSFICIKSHERLHSFLSLVLMKYRFISFLLFGKRNALLKERYLPNYKIKIFQRLKMEIRSYCIVLLDYINVDDFYKIKRYFKLLTIILYKNFVELHDHNFTFNEQQIQKDYLRCNFYYTMVDSLLKK